ncbi:MAG: cytochrome bc complex cytochrome b subunit [Leptolyngbya sp. SIO1D8]|nr:cytochrome bc complex cytochrome b subunit [Leptolyngbya sp. SIO1D8]
MTDKDLEFAGKVGKIASHFPAAWQNYQDWLREIVASRSALLERYPVRQAVWIFRWRLLYFVVYVAGVILMSHLLEGLRSGWRVGSLLKARLASAKAQITTRFPLLTQYRYILQRTATLLAVAELTLCGLAAFTGILLAFYYQPAAMGAYESLTTIMHEIASGGLILSLHEIAGNGLIALALVQIVVMFLGRQFWPTWLVGWFSGLFLTLTAIGLSWTAIVLNWDQTGFWRFKVELSIVASIPGLGPMLRDVLSGGGGINSITLQHMYTLHSYVLAIAAIVLSIVHLSALVWQEQESKKAGEPETRSQESVPY